MVKIMLQFAIKFLSRDADLEFVRLSGSIYIFFRDFCRNAEKFHINLVFVAALNRCNKTFGFEIMKHVYLHDL